MVDNRQGMLNNGLSYNLNAENDSSPIDQQQKPEATHDDVVKHLQQANPTIQDLFNDGFYLWINAAKTDGFQGSYATADETVFKLTRMILNGIIVNTTIAGDYHIDGNELSISLVKESESKSITVHIFSNGNLIAQRVDKDSLAQSMTKAAIEDHFSTTQEGRMRLTSINTNNPYAFAVAMLQDLQTAKYNEDLAIRISQTMTDQVEWINKGNIELE